MQGSNFSFKQVVPSKTLHSAMEVKTISCCKIITAEVAVDIDKIKYKISHIHNTNEVFEYPFTISVGDGLNYHGKIVLWRYFPILGCYVYNVKSLDGNVSMRISEGRIISKCCATDSETIPNAKYLEAEVGEPGFMWNMMDMDLKPATFLKGSFTIKFEPLGEKLLEEHLVNSFSLLKQDHLNGPNDVNLVFQEKEFEFNMSCLSKISPVFKDMFELLSGEMNIPISNDVTTLQTMETFHKLLAKKPVLPQDITVNLYLFADKYDIKPLLHFCGEYLGPKINMENVLEIALAADRADDEVLLKKAATFLMSNPCEKFHKFFKKNPDFAKNLFLSFLKK